MRNRESMGDVCRAMLSDIEKRSLSRVTWIERPPDERSTRNRHAWNSSSPYSGSVLSERVLDRNLATIGRHHRHQRVNIVTIPGVGECRQGVVLGPDPVDSAD